jgi:ornithine cyclodeaminase
MRIIGAEEIARALTYPELVETLRQAFAGEVVAPTRYSHGIQRDGRDAALILMPAWDATAGFLGTKIVTVFPQNASRGKPSVMGTYVLMSGETGEPLAALDGQALTLWRTAAASALAADYLARSGARDLAMVGAGALAPHLIAAHAAMRPIRTVRIWNRTRDAAERLAQNVRAAGLRVEIAPDIESAVRGADIVSVATLSGQPLLHGAWLSAGAHVDLVGAYLPSMREADDETVRRARIFVDTRDGALKEAGDLIQPIGAGIISESDIGGELAELCRGTVAGRRDTAEITLFKSVGAAIEDLAAAVHVYRRT